MTSTSRQTPAYRRRRHYVDRAVQRPLLLAMILIEIVLVAAFVWLMHWRLVGFIDNNMYRMHATETGLTLMRLDREGSPVLFLFLVANLLVLAIAFRLWSARQDLIVNDLRALIAKTGSLDFSPDPESKHRHKALALALAWRGTERRRFAAIRDQVARLEVAVITGEPPQNLSVSVGSLKELLH